jgi:hypothetical protein
MQWFIEPEKGVTPGNFFEKKFPQGHTKNQIYENE